MRPSPFFMETMMHRKMPGHVPFPLHLIHNKNITLFLIVHIFIECEYLLHLVFLIQVAQQKSQSTSYSLKIFLNQITLWETLEINKERLFYCEMRLSITDNCLKWSNFSFILNTLMQYCFYRKPLTHGLVPFTKQCLGNYFCCVFITHLHDPFSSCVPVQTNTAVLLIFTLSFHIIRARVTWTVIYPQGNRRVEFT